MKLLSRTYRMLLIPHPLIFLPQFRTSRVQQDLSLCHSHLATNYEDDSNPWRFDPSQNCSTIFPIE